MVLLAPLLSGCRSAIRGVHLTTVLLQRQQQLLSKCAYATLPPHTVLAMPALSPTMNQGNLAKWHVKVGDLVRPGSVLAEIETDKATLAFENQDDGYVANLLVPDGSKDIPIGQPVCILCEDEDSISAFVGYQPEGSATAATQEAGTKQPAATPKTTAASPSGTQANHRLGPAVRKLLAESGLSPSDITPTGPRNIITKGDVLAAINAGVKPSAAKVQPTSAAPTQTAAPTQAAAPKPAAAAAAAPKAPAPKPAAAAPSGPAYTDIKNSRIRNVIATRLLQSKRGNPALYLETSVNMGRAMALRKALKAQGVQLSVNDLVLKAVATALTQVPDANVQWDDKTEGPVPFKGVNIAVAVATPTGLITPVVRDAGRKTVTQISAEVRELAQRARDNKLMPDDYMGGSFSVSNLGMFGLSSFCAIINPPQSGILAVAGIHEGVEMVDGAPTAVSRMAATLTGDARIYDGQLAADFLNAFKHNLESPADLV